MYGKAHSHSPIFEMSWSPAKSALTILLTVLFLVFLFLFLTLTATPAQGQTFKVIHTFTGHGDGGWPSSGLTMDRAGNLYGTASGGGTGSGVVFKLSYKGSGWVLAPIYTFQGSVGGGSDGAYPAGRVIIGPDGALYGTTAYGGVAGGCGGQGCGTVFKLAPGGNIPPNVSGGWTETILYRFTGGSDGAVPYLGDLIFDQAGNIFGTTTSGGSGNCGGVTCGVVFKLTPTGGGWTETVLHAFTGGNDGGQPYSGVIIDRSGNLYGTTFYGGPAGGCNGQGCGTVFQLTQSGSGWSENVLYSFQGGDDGASPAAGVIFGHSGELYGSTFYGGYIEGGTVFVLAPSGGGWTETVLSSLAYYPYGGGPLASLTLDAAGNLYGTTNGAGEYGWGAVFKLTPGYPDWTYTILHNFLGRDGEVPISNVIFDASGNLYGTASFFPGAAGTVWEITP